MSRVLVISPHPDDESIGCGGTLRKHVLEGDTVHVIFLTSGENGGHWRTPEETGPLREQEAQAAAAILGIAKTEFWREPNGALKVTHQLVSRLRHELEAWKPEILYVTHAQEMHPEHRAAVRLVRRAISALGASWVPPDVLMFEVWTPMEQFDEIVDISPYLEAKLAAVRAHDSQCSVMRFDEACLGLSRYRGEMHSWPGGDYAEVFRRMRR
jgi:N-acetylglucosamine malate deacetylase 1